eukprot:CAMPEP_0196825040 /NCGR_PEP_ID=MMETSP1362-20130617/92826_1 /TAXON_ID=163516 /ORGANISM="Leptocylindrus danicus, Strain CCMP1856" /LENGTH=207 /DNA_ID=CAMNT_0042205407 /DNA_START=974 /DNA_END=1597 /DNA_ORIENTATION=-
MLKSVLRNPPLYGRARSKHTDKKNHEAVVSSVVAPILMESQVKHDCSVESFNADGSSASPLTKSGILLSSVPSIVTDASSCNEDEVPSMNAVATKKVKRKHVTWIGLSHDVPIRSAARKKLTRRSRSSSSTRKAKKQREVISYNACCSAETYKWPKNLTVEKKVLSKPKESKQRRNGQEVTAVQYLTGTLYIYRGSNPRVEFVRKHR